MSLFPCRSINKLHRMKIRKFFFLFFGIPLHPLSLRSYPDKLNNRQLREPDGSKICRRNILALSSIVILAGCMGAGPHEIDFFGVKPSGERAVSIFCAFIFLVQIYWYIKKYFHLKDDGTIEEFQPQTGGTSSYSMTGSDHLDGVPRRADLLSNIMALVLTLLSWCFIYAWIVADMRGS